VFGKTKPTSFLLIKRLAPATCHKPGRPVVGEADNDAGDEQKHEETARMSLMWSHCLAARQFSEATASSGATAWISEACGARRPATIVRD
jgi:hypothetical protein